MGTKRKKAAALKYEAGYEAPVVTAAGMGVIAENIIKTAEENKVPVVENEELANLLNNVDIDKCIPEELYEAAAQVIAYVMEADKIMNSR